MTQRFAFRQFLNIAYGAAKIQFHETVDGPFIVLSGIVQPVAFELVAGDSTPGSGPARNVDILLMSLWSAAVWAAAGIIRRERAGGTLAAITAAVHSAYGVVLGKTFGALVCIVPVAVASIVTTCVVVNRPILPSALPIVLAALLLVSCSAVAISMVLGSVLIITRFGAQISSLLLYPVYLVSGVLISADSLPQWVRPLHYGSTLWWCRATYQEGLSGSARPAATCIAALLALTASYSIISVVMFQFVERRIRVRATVGLL